MIYAVLLHFNFFIIYVLFPQNLNPKKYRSDKKMLLKPLVWDYFRDLERVECIIELILVLLRLNSPPKVAQSTGV